MEEHHHHLESAVQTLWQETRELSLGTPPHIDHLPTPPTPLHFLRNYLSPNKPCLITLPPSSPFSPALSLWPTPTYLPSTLSSTPVSLHLTPSGHADALTPHPTSPSSLCFASAHVEHLPFTEALDIVKDSGKKTVVGYLQEQNDCFRGEYEGLAGDCPGDVEWASEALGCLPEAVNLWVGSRESETWFHKDHYENFYVVVSGEKRFVLVPPCDVHRMYVREYPAAKYVYHKDSEEFTLELEDPVRYVPWCSVNPYPSPEEKEREIEKFPLYFNGPKPYEVTVKAGEMLYLPSMWFHHVRQSQDDEGLTIAINYWYDMVFDIKYAYFNFLQSIPHSLLKDPTSCKAKNVACRSLCNSRDESDITASLVNGVRGDGSDNEEED